MLSTLTRRTLIVCVIGFLTSSSYYCFDDELKMKFIDDFQPVRKYYWVSMLYMLVSRTIYKGSAFIMAGNPDILAPPGKIDRSAGTWKTRDLLTCLVIFLLPTGCILVGLSISNHFGPPSQFYSDLDVVVDATRLNYSWYNTHNLTVRLAGGLGNQMFQYASLVGIAKANGLKPLLDARGSRLRRIFADLGCRTETDRTELSKIEDGIGYSTYVERKSNAFENRAFSLNFMLNIRLSGFYQSWRYFDHVRSETRKRLSAFPPRVTAKVEQFLDSVLTSHAMLSEDGMPPKLVGVHVRRGDFLDGENAEKGYSVADGYFYRRAMQFFRGKFEAVVFVVCSDDPEWSKTHIKSGGQGSVVVHSKFSGPAFDPAYDLRLLSSCNHTIFSGSTFGWWGAWLAGGLVVYNREFPKPDSQLYYQFRFSDYYLPQWLPM